MTTLELITFKPPYEFKCLGKEDNNLNSQKNSTKR